MTPQSIFLVTSAIQTKFGVFDLQTRLDQTLNTIYSIRSRVPTATVVVLEMSASRVSPEIESELLKHVNLVLFFAESEAVKATAKLENNWDIVKNYNEVACFGSALKYLTDNKAVVNINARFFKVSGRYVLNDDFDPAMHYGSRDIVFCRSLPSQFDSTITGGIERQYMSRCWSFPAAKLNDIINTFDSMRRVMEVYYSQNHYVDIEHLLYLYMPKHGVTEVDKIGVGGQLGPNGVEVKD